MSANIHRSQHAHKTHTPHSSLPALPTVIFPQKALVSPFPPPPLPTPQAPCVPGTLCPHMHTPHTGAFSDQDFSCSHSDVSGRPRSSLVLSVGWELTAIMALFTAGSILDSHAWLGHHHVLAGDPFRRRISLVSNAPDWGGQGGVGSNRIWGACLLTTPILLSRLLDPCDSWSEAAGSPQGCGLWDV